MIERGLNDAARGYEQIRVATNRRGKLLNKFIRREPRKRNKIYTRQEPAQQRHQDATVGFKGAMLVVVNDKRITGNETEYAVDVTENISRFSGYNEDALPAK